MGTSCKDKVEEFTEAFKKLQSDFQLHAIVQSEIAIFQVKFLMEKSFRDLGKGIVLRIRECY